MTCEFIYLYLARRDSADTRYSDLGRALAISSYISVSTLPDCIAGLSWSIVSTIRYFESLKLPLDIVKGRVPSDYTRSTSMIPYPLRPHLRVYSTWTTHLASPSIHSVCLTVSIASLHVSSSLTSTKPLGPRILTLLTFRPSSSMML